MKNKNKSEISLEFLIGVVISVLLIVLAINIVAKMAGVGEDSKQSFYNLVEIINEVKDNPSGTIKSTSLRMDKETVILGFPKNNEPIKFTVSEASGFAPGFTTLSFEKPISEEKCEKDKACICLCGEIELKEKGRVVCNKNHLICKNVEDVDFPELSDKEGISIYLSKTNGFFISRSNIFKSWENSQLRPVYVEKYESGGNKLVSVCENPQDGSCLDPNYKKEIDTLTGLTKLKEFIESCKESEIREGDYCGCGLFAFDYEIPEGYGVKFSEEDEVLSLILRKDKKDTETKLEIPDIDFYDYLLYSEESQPIHHDNKVEIDNILLEIESDYAFCKKGTDNFCDESESKNQITFIKSQNNQVGIVSHPENEQGRVGLITDGLIEKKPNSIEVCYLMYGKCGYSLIIPGCS